MLILTRRIGEKVRIGDDTVVIGDACPLHLLSSGFPKSGHCLRLARRINRRRCGTPRKERVTIGFWRLLEASSGGGAHLQISVALWWRPSAELKTQGRAYAACRTDMHGNTEYRCYVSKKAAVVSKVVHLLLVENTPADVLLMRDAFRGSGIRLHVVTDGADAIAFLKRDAPHSFAPWPHLILLDLNLPKIHGHEVLAYIKTNDSLATIPTIILSSSDDIVDIEKSYRLHANCYLKKPVTFDEFEALVKSIKDFWFNKATLPPRATHA